MKSKESLKRAVSWLIVTVWMIVIFLLSAQNASQSGKTSGGVVRWLLSLLYGDFADFSPLRQQELLHFWHTVVRKGAHFSEYAVLAILIANALRVCGKLRWFLPVVLSGAYALTDEIHQYFVPGRACSLLDVGIDTCGALFGTALFLLGMFLYQKVRNIRQTKRECRRRDF